MQFTAFTTGAAVLLALAPSAMALGSATVINNCGYPVYYASVSQGVSASMQQLQGSYTQGYANENDGVSIKLSPNDTLSGPVSQFEFTWANGAIAYDLSNINGYPFVSGGMQIVPSMQNDASYPTCVDVTCPAGESVCAAAYNNPDDVATMVCSEDSNLVLTLCPGGSSKRSEPSFQAHVHHRAHARHMPKLA